MTNAEKLMAVGAQVVGGDLIWKHKVLGHFRNGDFMLTAEGKEILDQDIEDAVVKEVKPKAKKSKAAEATSAEDEIINDLLGE